MKNRHLLVLFGVIAVSIQTSAAENCKNPENQLAMNICSAQEYQREDAKLNKNYKELVGKLDRAERERLKAVQLSWIKFRDLQCDFDAAKYEGGSMQPLVRSSCLTQMTKQRNKDLRAMIEEASL